MTDELTNTATVSVDGTPVNLEALDDLRISLSLLESSTATMRLVDPNFVLIDSSLFAIGATMVVKLGAAVGTTVFDGEIVAIGVEQLRGQQHRIVVEAMDKSHRLSSTVKPTTYLNQTSSAIVSSIATDHGLQAQVTATTKTHEYLLKTVNDRSFLDELADDVGYEWFVRGSTLTFRPRPAPTALAATIDWSTEPRLRRLLARASAVDGAKQVQVRGWDDARSSEIFATADASTADVQAIGANSTLATETYSVGASTFGGTMVIVPGVLLDQDEADLRAKAIAADLQASTLRVSGECDGDARIAPGVWIKVDNCGAKLSGTYYVTDVEHIFGARQTLVTSFRLSGHAATGLSARRGQGGPVPFGQVGLVIGVVTNVKDDEKKMHRVKVRFPTLPNVESTWARVVTLGGEAASGMEARPEVDDEVLVGFEQGDPRRPFVIGGLLSKTDAYRTGAINGDGSINKRGIRTRNGNKLEMFDGDSRSAGTGRYIAIVGADGATEMRLGDDNMAMKTKNGNPITIQSGTAKITLDNGRITITGDAVEFKATQGFKAQGMTVDLKADTAMGLDAATSFKAHGAMVNVSADGIAEIKGTLLKLN